ncbi:hypothetical protein K9B35_14355 [Sphingomonas sp. R647]|uniref:hypothetical protein n=1 Tax=Sphingomonas sp. R647 TaxID=2875233 RepID=UPI001CD30762|nr:hypothetical protein [Sphingomonas sp. R647]MCA1199156.1 hypothetical protein [Sphingomonas sp. R647]
MSDDEPDRFYFEVDEIALDRPLTVREALLLTNSLSNLSATIAHALVANAAENKPQLTEKLDEVISRLTNYQRLMGRLAVAREPLDG